MLFPAPLLLKEFWIFDIHEGMMIVREPIHLLLRNLADPWNAEGLEWFPDHSIFLSSRQNVEKGEVFLLKLSHNLSWFLLND